MDIKDFLLDCISKKLRREKGMELSSGEYNGKRPDAVLKSSGSFVGLILVVFDETDEEIERRIGEFRGLGPPLYLLIRKGRQKAMTDMLWKKSLFDVKVVTWDIQVNL